MSLDQVENFVRVSVAGTHDSGASTVALESGEASELPLVTDGKYNLVWFDASGFAQPDADPNVEIVRVNSINTTNDTISVTRGVENTSATAKDTGTDYELLLTPTAKIIEDIDANKLDTNQRYTDGEAVSAITGEVIEPEQSIHSRTIENNLTLSSDDSLILIGPVTGTGSISGDGKFLIPNENTSSTTGSINADTLDGIDSSGFVKTTDPVDADTLDGIDSSGFVETSDTIDADTLDGLDASQLGIDVSNDSSTVITNATDINFGDGLTASDDSDGTSTVSADGSSSIQTQNFEIVENSSTESLNFNYTGS